MAGSIRAKEVAGGVGFIGDIREMARGVGDVRGALGLVGSVGT